MAGHGAICPKVSQLFIYFFSHFYSPCGNTGNRARRRWPKNTRKSFTSTARRSKCKTTHVVKRVCTTYVNICRARVIAVPTMKVWFVDTSRGGGEIAAFVPLKTHLSSWSAVRLCSAVFPPSNVLKSNTWDSSARLYIVYNAILVHRIDASESFDE